MTAKLSNGKELGLSSYENLLASVPNSIVVVDANDIRTREMYLTAGARTTLCESSSLGMSQSLIHGINANPDCDGWIVALGDMPFIAKKSIDKVASALRQGALLAVPQYLKKNGHPVGLSRHLKNEISKLKGDNGAKRVIKNHQASTVFIQTNDPGITRDIDVKEDLLTN